MKRILFLLACGLQVFTLEAQRGEHQPYLQKSFARGAVHELEVETSGGNISVFGSATGDARVEMYVQGDNGRWDLSKDEIQQRLTEQYDLIIELQGNKLVASARGKRNFQMRHGLSISFRVFTPVDVSSHIRTSGGHVELKDLSGNENLDASGGNVGVRGVTGTSRATTSGGEVAGGQITGELQAHTSGGNIELTDVSASLEASTSGGNIHVNFLSMGKYIDLSNSSGDITVILPQGQGMDLRISGERVHVTAMNNFRGDQDEHHIRGTLNGGGFSIKGEV